MNRFQQFLQMPWKVPNHLRRWGLLPFALAYCRAKGVKTDRSWQLFGLPLIQRHGGSQIIVGTGFSARGFYASNPLGARRCVLATRSAEAQIIIGREFGITGTVVVAENSITIGDYVKVGNGATIIDTDFHPLDPAHRRINPNDGRSTPIVIEDDVFIGMNALILKGSHIGARAIIGAGAVVSGVIPADTIAVGNPAVVVKSIAEQG